MTPELQDSLFSTSVSQSVVVFDFETTGMSPERGDRVIEVGAVRLQQGRVAAEFQSLINPGVPLDPYISDLTGICDDMLADAPAASGVIKAFRDFIGSSPLVAHNASFDQRFLVSELNRYYQPAPPAVGCSMLAARRVFPNAPNHKLGTLVNYLDIPAASRFHRALDDAKMTANLWYLMEKTLCERFGFTEVPFSVLQRLGRVPCERADAFLRKMVDES